MKKFFLFLGAFTIISASTLSAVFAHGDENGMGMMGWRSGNGGFAGMHWTSWIGMLLWWTVLVLGVVTLIKWILKK